MEFPFWKNTPIKITPDPSPKNWVHSWSHDGRFLAYETNQAFDINQADEKTLSIWDGISNSQIHHYRGDIHELNWGIDKRLAFTEFYNTRYPPASESDYSEIFVWEAGKSSATSLSQNPEGEDRFPVWGPEGKLAFLSNRDGEYDLYIWDGASELNGAPDVRSFTNIAPELTYYYSWPAWTNSGLLTFSGGSKSTDKYVQIYQWNGHTATNISQNPDYNNSGQSWRSDGYWSFSTFLSSKDLLYIRDKANQTVLLVEGNSPAWSADGLFLFCAKVKVNETHEWALSIWNGKEVVRIAQGYRIEASWGNGARVFCSSA